MSARPLLVTNDPELLEHVLRLAAAAGTEPDVAPDPLGVRRAWLAAPLVLVGADLLEEVATVGLPRRERVAVVGDDAGDDRVWPHALAIGAERVLFLPESESSLVAWLADAGESGARRARVVGVVGGRGGAGATTLAVALAVTSTRAGRPTLLVDVDPLGGGIDLALGAENVQGARWCDLADTSGRVSPAALTRALPAHEGLAVLSWDRSADLVLPTPAVEALFEAGERGHDLLVVDLPRRLDPAAAAALTHCDEVLLVVPAEVRAAAAASRVIAGASPHARSLRLVVRGPAPAGLPPEAIADALALPLAGVLRPEPGLAAALERGEPPARRGRGPLAALCARLLGELAPLGTEAA